MIEGYGLTEASPVVTSGLGLTAPEGSIGVPLPGVHVRLVDADGHVVGTDTVGEVQIRSRCNFIGCM